MEENKKSSGKWIVIVLLVLLLGALVYTFYNNSEHKKLTDQIEEEKLEIEENLDSMIVRYEDAIAQKTSMSNELAIERDRIISLRDSVKDLKTANYRSLRIYRREIRELEETNQKLFYLNDSLTVENKQLTINLDSANIKIIEQIAKFDTLTVENQELIQKVAIGSVLKVDNTKAIAMRERSSGKLVETSRSRYTDAFRINFTIDKNEISEQGERNVYVQIINSKGETLAPKGELVLTEELTVNYSDTSTVEYLNEAVDVISLVEVNRDDIQKGAYIVNIYVENKIAGTTKIVLK